MPRWVWYLIATVIAVVVAVFISPVFPAPLSTLLYWAGWIAALVFLIMAIVALVGHGRAGSRV